MSSKNEIDHQTEQGHIEEASARDVDSEMSLTIWETIKQKPVAIGYSIMISMGPLVYGYDLQIVGVVVAMPAFQSRFGSIVSGSYIIPAVWLALWTSLFQVGAMAGALISGPVSNRFGRRAAAILGGVVVSTGVFLLFFADRCGGLGTRRVVFLIGKIIEGSGLGLLNAACLTFVSEIAPARVRGPLLSCFTLFAVVGQTTAVAAVYARINILTESAYHVVLAVQWGLAALIIIISLIVPESPIYYLRRNKLETAGKHYKRIHPSVDVIAEITALQVIVEHEMEAEASADTTNFMQCFKGTDFRRTRIIIYAFILQQFVGITMVSNATYFLQLAGIGTSLSLTLSIVQLVLGIPSIMASWFTMTIFGRRAILLWGSFGSAVLWLAMGIAGCFPNSKAALWYIGISLIIIFVVYCLSVGAAYTVVAAETSSVNLRAASQSIGWFFQFFAGWAFSFTVPYMFDVDAGNLGGKVGFIFAFLSIVAVAIVWFEIPEMKNRSFADLDEMFAKRIPTRQFKNYTCSGVLPPMTKGEKEGL